MNTEDYLVLKKVNHWNAEQFLNFLDREEENMKADCKFSQAAFGCLKSIYQIKKMSVEQWDGLGGEWK